MATAVAVAVVVAVTGAVVEDVPVAVPGVGVTATLWLPVLKK